MITRGSQMGVDLVARALIRPGVIRSQEELGYQPAWRAFEASGARLAPIALDEAGLVVERFGKPGRGASTRRRIISIRRRC